MLVHKELIIRAIKSLVDEKTLPPDDTDLLSVMLEFYKRNLPGPGHPAPVAKRLSYYIEERIKFLQKSQ